MWIMLSNERKLRRKSDARRLAARYLALAMLMVSLTACKGSEGSPANAADSAGDEAAQEETTADPQRKELEELRDDPSVSWAIIEYRPTTSSDWGEELYRIELEEAVASVKLYKEEAKDYPLDEAQVEGLRRLLSEYALTIYEGGSYWPTGDCCTMVELFDFWISYDKGSYHETGAQRYPEGWEDFRDELRELIGVESQESEVPPRKNGKKERRQGLSAPAAS